MYIPDEKMISRYDNIKNKLYFKLVNSEMHKDRLKDMPHKMIFGDIAVIYSIAVCHDHESVTGIDINNKLLKALKVSPQRLHDDAINNMPKLFRAEINSLFGTVLNMAMEGDMPADSIKEMIQMDMSKGKKELILSNNLKINGASSILYPGLLRYIEQNFHQPYYYIPSSVHEFLLFPCNDGISVKELKEIVREVNDTVVSENEVLSYNVFVYDEEKDTLVVAADEDMESAEMKTLQGYAE